MIDTGTRTCENFRRVEPAGRRLEPASGAAHMGFDEALDTVKRSTAAGASQRFI